MATPILAIPLAERTDPSQGRGRREAESGVASALTANSEWGRQEQVPGQASQPRVGWKKKGEEKEQPRAVSGHPCLRGARVLFQLSSWTPARAGASRGGASGLRHLPLCCEALPSPSGQVHSSSSGQVHSGHGCCCPGSGSRPPGQPVVSGSEC